MVFSKMADLTASRALVSDGSGDVSWGSKTFGDYQVNRYLQAVSPGIYIWHVESHVSGHEGEDKAGTFVIIK